MSAMDDLYTDLDADPAACKQGYEPQRAAGLKRKIPNAGRPRSPFPNASMPQRDIGGIRRFSWEDVSTE